MSQVAELGRVHRPGLLGTDGDGRTRADDDAPRYQPSAATRRCGPRWARPLRQPLVECLSSTDRSTHTDRGHVLSPQTPRQWPRELIIEYPGIGIVLLRPGDAVVQHRADGGELLQQPCGGEEFTALREVVS